MESQFWLDRWRENRIGFHQSEGNENLQRYWPTLPPGSRILVPLCGKSLDMLWLAEQGYDVTGVELSPLAAEAFFKEQGMTHFKAEQGMGLTYRAQALSLRIVCGDFFVFEAPPFDALYDRASLIALPQEQRASYTDRCCRLLADGAAILLATLEYDQRQMGGPPYSVPEAEVASLWGDRLEPIWSEELIDKEPRFQKKGLNSFVEKTWLGGCEGQAEKPAQIGFSDKS